jgi:hypothetical protein
MTREGVMTAKQHSEPNGRMISISKAAEMIGCYPHTIRRRIGEGQLIGYRAGGGSSASI